MNALSSALAAVKNAVQEVSSEKARMCREILEKELPPHRTKFSEDLYQVMTSYLEPAEIAKLKRVSYDERRMAVKAGDNLVRRINGEKLSLAKLGFKSLKEVISFFKESSTKLTYLDLRLWAISDDDCQKLEQSFPNVNHLFIRSSIITDDGLSHFRGMPLTSVDFSGCEKITNGGRFLLV